MKSDQDSARRRGWYGDPDSGDSIRYWTGEEWTEQRLRPDGWSGLPEPGWQDNPHGEDVQTYWNGLEWTDEHRRRTGSGGFEIMTQNGSSGGAVSKVVGKLKKKANQANARLEAREGASEERAQASEEGPLMELSGGRLKTGEWSPNVVRVHEDRIVETDKGFLKEAERAIRYEDVAQVRLDTGLMYATLTIESKGGDGIVADGLKNAEAKEAKRLIEERSAAAGQQSRKPSQVVEEKSTADELRKMKELHEQGVLTDDEFEQQKAKLLA